MALKKIGVVGAGQMGNGIAQVLAAHEFQVAMMDVSQEALDKGLATISKSCDRLIKKEKMTDDQKNQLLGRITTHHDLSGFSDADMVIEAATENIDLKLKIFKNLDQVVPAHCILATNTSSISITKIAAATNRPSKVAGMHFMNPVPIMVLVEGIRGLQTSDETFNTVKGLTET